MNEDKNILVVDDEEGWLETIRGILEANYELTLLTNHEQSMECLRKRPYALVILDMNLPGISGLDLFKKMRVIDPHLRAIVLTGYADVDSAVASMKIGALDYISKGTTNLASVLRARVEEALARESFLDAPVTDDIAALISKGESAELEFKSSARWDVHQHRLNKDLEKAVVKTVAAFLNSYRGGILLLGVGDDGVVIGLKSDYSTLRRKNRDGYENLLITLLVEALGTECSPFIAVIFHKLGGEEICQISVRPSPKPMFVADREAENLFIRSGNSTRLLSTREALEYCEGRWPRSG